MTLYEMSFTYRADALRFALRISELRAALREEADREAARSLRRRIDELQPLYRQSRELAELTAHYYERSYHRSEKYTL